MRLRTTAAQTSQFEDQATILDQFIQNPVHADIYVGAGPRPPEDPGDALDQL